MKFLTCTLAIVLFATSGAFSQQSIKVYDGTTQATSRGAAGTAAKTLMQRYPADQICGATVLTSVTVTIQDQNIATQETCTLEVRTNNPAGPATGSPDMSAAGLVGSVAVPLFTFPGAGPISAAVLTITFPAPGLALPAFATTASPAADLYVGLAFPASPGWTADGISLHASGAFAPSPGEQMLTTAAGYTGAAGVAGLGWDCNTTAGTQALGTANRAWDITTFFSNDVLQVFADNPAVFTGAANGLNPNFGYAGIFPDVVRGDGIGYRALVTAPVGSLANLFVTLPPLLPAPIAALPVGVICIDPNTTLPAPVTPIFTVPTVAAPAGQGATTSMAMFGPFPAGAAAAGLVIHAQCLTLDGVTGAPRLSNVATLHM